MKKEFLTRQEVADIFGVHSQTVSNWINESLLSSRAFGNRVLISTESVELLRKTVPDIGSIENNIIRYRAQLVELKKELNNTTDNVKTEIARFCDVSRNVYLVKDLFSKAFSILSRGHESQRTIDIVCSYIKGEKMDSIADRHNISFCRVAQIAKSGILRLSRAEGYADVLTENKKLRREKAEYELKISVLREEAKKVVVKEETQEQKEMIHLLSEKILYDGLSRRTCNILRACDIATYGDLVQFRRTDVLKFRNCGKQTVAELDSLIKEKGLYWGMDICSFL